MSTANPDRANVTLRAILFSLAYFACSWIGDWLTIKPSLFCTFWPNSGLFLAVLLLSPARTWPAFILAAIPANLAFDVLNGRPIWVSGLFTLGNCGEALLGAWLIQRFSHETQRMQSIRDIAYLILAALSATAVSATAGTFALTLAFDTTPMHQWLKWWSSDALGILIVTPFVLTAVRSESARYRGAGSLPELGALLATAVATTIAIFHEALLGLQWTFLYTPLVVWAAMRFSMREVAAFNLVGGITVALVEHFVHTGTGLPHAWHSTVNVDGFLVVSSILGLIMAGSRRERDVAQEVARKNEEHLANLQKIEALGLLAGGIAHDFNNLLGSIFANVELALDATKEPTARSFLGKTMAAMSPTRGLTRQLLTFTKGGEPVCTPNPLFPMVEDATRMALSGSRTVARFNVAGNLHICTYDAAQLTQVVTNIAINASQAMPQGGTFTITAANITLNDNAVLKLPAGPYIQLRFSDEGPGIPPDLLPRIFDPFFTTKPTGSGLGLAVAHSIIRKHSGAITVECPPGKGTTFNIYLPATREKPPAPPTPRASTPESRGGTILVMDDDKDLRLVVGLTLKALGYRSVETANGEEALRWLKDALARNEPPVAALLDLTVQGGMGGVEVAALIHEISPGLPLIATSGYADDPAIAHPERFGFAAALSKPCHKKDLAATLVRVGPR